MHSGVLFILVLTLICWALHLLPVISVPITSVSSKYRIELSYFRNVSYGVFGFCLTKYESCSKASIGYVGDVVFPSVPEEFQLGNPVNLVLPSRAMQTFSKLLFVHVVAFIFTSFLLVTIVCCMLQEYFTLQDPVEKLKKDAKKRKGTGLEPDPTADYDELHYIYLQKRRKSFNIYFGIMLVFSIFLFLLALLGFLADILIFVPFLGWVGWVQLAVVLIMALISSLVCFMKRSIMSRRHLEEEVYSLGRISSRQSDNDSDLGVYIYSNGFLTANDDNQEENNNELNGVHSRSSIHTSNAVGLSGHSRE